MSNKSHFKILQIDASVTIINNTLVVKTKRLLSEIGSSSTQFSYTQISPFVARNESSNTCQSASQKYSESTILVIRSDKSPIIKCLYTVFIWKSQRLHDE